MTFTFQITFPLSCVKDKKFLLKFSKLKLPLHFPKGGFLQYWRKEGDVFMKPQKVRLHKASRLGVLAHPQPFLFAEKELFLLSQCSHNWLEASEGLERQ